MVEDDDETVPRLRLRRVMPPEVPEWPKGSVLPMAAGPVDPAASRRDDGESIGRSWLPGPAAFDPGRRGVRVLAVVTAVVALAAAGWAWRSRPQTEPVAAETAIEASGTPTTDPAGGPGAGDAELVVAVAGRVRQPGLVRLPAGARVADALAGAGGALPGVDVSLLNLARKVTDGELILVGVSAPPGQPGAGAPIAGVPGAGDGKINLNTADVGQLDTLPGVGPVLAQRIIDHREQHGPFRSVSDLRRVSGIGEARYQELKDLVTV